MGCYKIILQQPIIYFFSVSLRFTIEFLKAKPVVKIAATATSNLIALLSMIFQFNN
jgi:hypothetical protein